MFCLLFYVFDMFHILLPGDSLRDLWNERTNVCMYYIRMYVCQLMVRKTKILKHAASEGKEVLNNVYFGVLCVRECTCVLRLGSMHALVV